MAKPTIFQLEYDKFSTTASGDTAVRTVSVTPTTAFGQAKVAASRAQLPNVALTNGVIFQAKSTNAGDIMLGDSTVTTTEDGTGNGYILEPGNSITYACDNLNRVWFIGTANDVLSYAGS